MIVQTPDDRKKHCSAVPRAFAAWNIVGVSFFFLPLLLLSKFAQKLAEICFWPGTNTAFEEGNAMKILELAKASVGGGLYSWRSVC